MTKLKLFLVESEQANPLLIDRPVLNEVHMIGETNETNQQHKKCGVYIRTYFLSKNIDDIFTNTTVTFYITPVI